MSDADACASALLDLLPPLMQEIRGSMRGGRGKGISVPQFRTLAMVAHCPGASLSDAAAHVGLGTSAMSVLVDGLVRRRLLSRRSAPGDRRRAVLALTPAGRAMWTRSRAATRRMLAVRLDRLSGRDISAITAATRLLHTIFAGPATGTAEAARDSEP